MAKSAPRPGRNRHVLPLDPVKSATVAGLRYVTGTGQGFTRKRAGKGFSFLDHEGKPIRDREVLQRIRSLVLPPAWERVWICPLPHGHLQAVGYDQRGRKQYRYHSVYRQIRDHTKFSRMLDFAAVLPAIRERVQKDLARPDLPREKVLATVVRLLETTFMRIGNVEYAKQNQSFGLTTLRNRHVDIEGSTIKFNFRGKSGQDHEISIQDRRVAKIVKQCQELPGYELFQYIDEAGERHSVDSSDVNAYLQEITQQEFTAKDFRTWAGTIQCALALAEIGPFESETEAKRNIVTAIKATASQLGNRPATCRSYYVHPAVLDSYMDGTLLSTIKPPEEASCPQVAGLHPEEACVVELIRSKAATLIQNLPLQAA